MIKLLNILVFPLLLTAAQPDFWQATKVSKLLTQKYTLSLESDFRSINMGGQLKYSHGDIGISVPFLGPFKLSLNFREVFEWKNEAWTQEHRPHGTLSTKMKFGMLGLSARSRFEYRMKQGKDPVIRNRDMIAVNFGKGFTPLKLIPYTADEIFYDLEESELNRNRFYVGFEIKSISFMKTTVYYLQQSDLKDNKWDPTNVVGLKLSI